jgi:hypothetical protein
MVTRVLRIPFGACRHGPASNALLTSQLFIFDHPGASTVSQRYSRQALAVDDLPRYLYRRHMNNRFLPAPAEFATSCTQKINGNSENMILAMNALSPDIRINRTGQPGRP